MKKQPAQKAQVTTSALIKSTTDSIKNGIAMATGVAASGRKEWALSIGRIVQASFSGDLLNQLQVELDGYKKAGKIKDDYEQTYQCKSLLAELLKYLDQDIPDENVFRVLKQIFIVAATEAASSRNDVEPLIYAKIVRKLSPEALLVLNACYQSLGKMGSQNPSFAVWATAISERSGIRYREFIDLCRKELTDNKLLDEMARTAMNEYFFSNTQNGVGLTDLGMNLCVYIINYNK